MAADIERELEAFNTFTRTQPEPSALKARPPPAIEDRDDDNDAEVDHFDGL